MDIKFHLPDFVRHFRLNLTLAEYMSRFPDAFVDGVKIGSVYGCFPNMTWNGGRFIQEKYRQEEKICAHLPDMHSYAGGIVCHQHFAQPEKQ